MRRLSAGALCAHRSSGRVDRQAHRTLEQRWNDSARSDAARRTLGFITMLIVAGSAGAVGYAIQIGAQQLPFGMVIVVLVATMGLAQRSLYTHVRDVQRPLARDDLPAAREAVSKIVGAIRHSSRRPESWPLQSKASPKVSTTGSSPPRSGLRSADCRTVRVQSTEHSRQPHRSSRAALARVRLGSRAPTTWPISFRRASLVC